MSQSDVGGMKTMAGNEADQNCDVTELYSESLAIFNSKAGGSATDLLCKALFPRCVSIVLEYSGD